MTTLSHMWKQCSTDLKQTTLRFMPFSSTTIIFMPTWAETFLPNRTWDCVSIPAVSNLQVYGNYCLSRTDKEPQKKKKQKNNEVAGHLSAAWRKCKQSEFANTLKVNKRRWDIRVTITGQHFTVSKYEKRHTHSHDFKKSKRNNEMERTR